MLYSYQNTSDFADYIDNDLDGCSSNQKIKIALSFILTNLDAFYPDYIFLCKKKSMKE